MDYECDVMPFNKIAMDGGGVKNPLCNDCLAPDCGNPIRDKIVSVMGVPKCMRLWVVNDVVRQVVMCKGYVSKKNVVVRTSQENGDQSEGGSGGLGKAGPPHH